MFKPGQPGVKSKGLIYCKQDGQSISSHTEALNSILPIVEERMKEFIKKNSQKAADFAEHKTSEYLPEGWLCKDTPENSIQINVVSTDGLRFYSYKKAAEHMKALEYSEEDINKFFLYPDGKDLKQYWKDRILKGENDGGSEAEWEENEYLPAGWKCKTVSQGILVMSGEGDRFPSYIKAVEFMKSSEAYSEEDIERFYCYPDGKPHNLKEHRVDWEASEYLPAYWKCRESKHNTIDVMARGGEKFTSYKKAVEFMKASESYTNEDIKKFYCYPDGKTHDLETKRIEEAKRIEELRKENEARRVVEAMKKRAEEAAKMVEQKRMQEVRW